LRKNLFLALLLFLLMLGCTGGEVGLKGLLPSPTEVQGVTKEG